MKHCITILASLTMLLIAGSVSAQRVREVSGTLVQSSRNELQSRPLNPDIDPDIDMFISSWETSIPFNTHGNLTERAIFMPLDEGADPVWPKKKGNVLRFVNRFTYAILGEQDSTTPTTLRGEQEILYIVGGHGAIVTNGTTADLHKGVFVLVPADCEFTMKNDRDEILKMYLVSEPTPEGFRPNSDILVRDENSMTLRDAGYLQTHWSHNGKNIFNVDDGLAALELVNFLSADPMTIGQPHSHDEKVEEVWTLVSGEKNLAFLGKEVRWQYPGMAYKIPPTGFTPHSNINATDEPIRFFYFARFQDHRTRP